MKYRIHEIQLKLTEDVECIPQKIKKKLGAPDLKVISWEILKESIDARDKSNIRKTYTVDFEANSKMLNLNKLEKSTPYEYEYVPMGSVPLKNPPIIVGFGPAGMFAALILSQMGYRPIVIERGKKVEDRLKDVEAFWKEGIINENSNVQFGEGGAGTFSDGKLTTRIKDSRVKKVLQELIKAGANPEILYKQKPHLGTDKLNFIVPNIRESIKENGGTILFESQLTGIILGQEGQVRSIMVNGEKEIETSLLILAIGHSARDTIRMIYDNGMEIVQKPFSIGVRIEHSRKLVDVAQYGEAPGVKSLGAADYQLSHRCKNGRGVYTFCMCPGGMVIASSSQKGTVVTNGMSYESRAEENSNSGLLVDVRTEDFEDDHPLAGIAFQEKYERRAFEAGGSNYYAPVTRLRDFLIENESTEEIKGLMRNETTEEIKGLMTDDYVGFKDLMTNDYVRLKDLTRYDYTKNTSDNTVGQNRPNENKHEFCIKDTINPTYKPGVKFTDITSCLPSFVTDALREAIPVLGQRLKGFDRGDSLMTAVETRSSSPVRIIRDEDFQSNIRGIYPAGEGAGYAGGIVSAAVDGIKVAESIAKNYKNGGY